MGRWTATPRDGPAPSASCRGAPAQLRHAIQLGVPTGPDDDESRLLYELDALTGTSSAFSVLSSAFYDRQVELYAGILRGGAAAGELRLAASPEAIARGHRGDGGRAGPAGRDRPPRRGTAEAERILLRYASAMTGVELVADTPVAV